MPSKVYETLASGVPVVISEGCEGARVVQEGNAGRTFRPNDPDDLAEALIELAANEDELAQIGKTCRDLAERFDYNRVAAETEAVLNAVAHGAAIPQPDK